MLKLLDSLPGESRKKIKKRDQPEWSRPMLASLSDKRFSDPAWIYERKLDGERCLVLKKGKELRLMSRNKKELNDNYPEIIEAVKKQDHNFIADGEVVSFEGDISSFEKLQHRMHSERDNEDRDIKIYYYLFDLLHIDGYDISKLPLKERKSILKSAIEFDGDILRYCEHINEDGEKYLEEACSKGWEGVIAKDGESAYVHSRSKKWLKFKCENRQELVIGGYTDPEGSRKGFGALLVGYYDNDKLQYAGKVGTGFSDELLQDMYAKMKKREIDSNPFRQDDINEKNVHWIDPGLVGEFRFTEWTEKNRLRHPSFLGLRRDKKAKDVKKEKG